MIVNTRPTSYSPAGIGPIIHLGNFDFKSYLKDLYDKFSCYNS